jgi:hypothetical protein
LRKLYTIVAGLKIAAAVSRTDVVSETQLNATLHARWKEFDRISRKALVNLRWRNLTRTRDLRCRHPCNSVLLKIAMNESKARLIYKVSRWLHISLFRQKTEMLAHGKVNLQLF